MEKRYLSKPQFVEAVQWTGRNILEVVNFGRSSVRVEERLDKPTTLILLTGVGGAQGWVPVPIGYYIVHSVDDDQNHFWPVDAEYFEAKYEEV